MADEYDIAEAFRKIELELISSMKRNWQRHLNEENEAGFTWSMWQAEQLKALESYKKRNPKLFASDFEQINEKFLDQILAQKETNFFAADDRRINALANAATNDLKKAEMSLLRQANDEYRKTIYAAHAYLESGAGSIQKAVDMASQDFLEKGINSIVYKNGRRVNIADYSEMALRTASTRSRLMADGDLRKGMGVHTVKVSHYGACSETCLPWQGRVYVDDVYSGGTAEEAQKLGLPLLSTAIEGGLFHPNCRHTLITYYPGIENDTDGIIRGNTKTITYEHPPLERQHIIYQHEIQKQKRIALGSLDPAKVEQANQKIVSITDKDISTVDSLSEQKSLRRMNIDEFANSSLPRTGIARIPKFDFLNAISDIVDYPENRIKHITIDHPERAGESLANIINAIEHPSLIASDESEEHPERKNTFVFASDLTEKQILGVYVKIRVNDENPRINKNNWIVTVYRTKKKKFLRKYGDKNLLKKK